MIKCFLVTRAKAILDAALVSVALLSTTPAMAGRGAPGIFSLATAKVCGLAAIVRVHPCCLLESRDFCEPTAIVPDFDDPCRSWCWLPFVPYLPTPNP